MKEKLLKIKLIAMDVDGVLTDGRIIYTSAGAEIKEFHIQDGMGITMARMAGLKTAIITGRLSEMVKRRATELKYDWISQGHFDKRVPYTDLKRELDLSDEEICYIGDDIQDMPVLKQVGFSVAVANARDDVKAICDYTTIQHGGRGAVRETIDKILKAQGKLHNLVEKLGR